MRHALALTCLVAATWSRATAALELPAYVPGQQVYLVPADFRFPTQQVKQAASQTEHPVYVAIYEQVIDGSIEPGHESETEDAIEALWAEWRTAAGMLETPVEGGLDGVEGSLVLLAMDDREVRVITGSRWDSELGLHNEALLPVIDTHFMPKAQAQDYDGGLAALVTGLDGYISKELARRAAQAEVEAAAAAQAEVDRIEAERQREEMKATMGRVVRWGGAGLGGLLVLVLVGIFRFAARGARRRFDEAAARLRAQLDAADNAFADFRIDVELRDRIVELRVKGPVTTALVEEVSRTLDEIQVGLAGLRRHVDECEADVDAGYFGRQAWLDAVERLEGRLEIRTEQTQDRLFPLPDQVLEVEPAVFMEGLEERFATARTGWKRVLDAVEASLHKASTDLARDDLETMLAKLEAAGLPQIWVDEHPLLEDPEACWAELDALRREDPAAYLDALEEEIELDDELEAVVSALIEGLGLASELRAKAEEPSVEGLDTVVGDPERDPAPLQLQADTLLTQLRDIAHARVEADFDVFEDTLGELELACDAWVERKGRLLASVERAPGLVEQAEAKLAELERDYGSSRDRAKALAGQHNAESLAQAWVEVGEARDDLEQCRQAALQSRARLGERRHVEAEGLAEQALEEHGQAVVDLGELTAALVALEQARLEAVHALTSMSDFRRRSLQTLAGFGAFGGEDRLAEGDAQRRALEAKWTTAVPADWAERRDRAKAVMSAWGAGVAAARAAYRAEQARIEAERRAEEERRRRARQRERERRRREEQERAARSRRRTSSPSFGSFGSSSRKKRSSFGSSSRRSSGSSFGRKRRSSGRRFGGGGRKRSGGRKF